MMSQTPMDGDSREHFRSMFGPGQVDQMIKQAVQFAWMSLPDEKKIIANVEEIVRRIVDRNIEAMKEDEDFFTVL